MMTLIEAAPIPSFSVAGESELGRLAGQGTIASIA
jgi:ribosomal protein L7Ae-like RNA K-turn-binding protein